MNDMLRDLDGRSETAQDLGNAEPPPPKEPRRSGVLWVLMALLTCGLVGLLVWWPWVTQVPKGASAHAAEAPPTAVQPVAQRAPQADLPTGSEEESAPEQHEMPHVAEKPREAQPQEGTPAAATDQPVVEQAAVEQAAAAQGEAIRALLANAEQALADDRLTRPPVNNAYALYKHVLLLQPDNRQALDGIERVRQRYCQLIEGALRDGEHSTVAAYISRAALVGVPEETLARYRKQLEQTHKPELSGAEAQAAAVATAPVMTSQTEASLTRSDRSLAAEAVARAGRLRQQGKMLQAIQVLEPLVASEARTDSAVLMLFDLYLAEGDVDKARGLAGGAGSVGLDHYMGARLLIEADDSDQALELLEKVEPKPEILEPYLALQGALNQRLGQYREAMRIYRYLTGVNRNNFQYWLGLAVAAEAADEHEQALRAFVAADQFSAVAPAVSDYIRERIAALSAARR